MKTFKKVLKTTEGWVIKSYSGGGGMILWSRYEDLSDFVLSKLEMNGRFQKISIPISRTAFRISEGEGEFMIMEF